MGGILGYPFRRFYAAFLPDLYECPVCFALVVREKQAPHFATHNIA